MVIVVIVVVEIVATVVVSVVAVMVDMAVAAEIAGLVVAETVTVVAVEAAGDKHPGIFINKRNTSNQKIILRCYNLKEQSIGKHRRVGSVRRLRGETPSLSVRML
jgi:hypothetical protein